MIDEMKWRVVWQLMEDRWGRKSVELRTFYLDELNDVGASTQDAMEAARGVIRNEVYFPSVHQLLKYVPGIVQWPKAIEEWSLVRQLLGNAGNSLDQLTEPAKRAVRVMGGLRAIGASERELEWKRREFCEMYEAFADRSRQLGELPKRKLVPMSATERIEYEGRMRLMERGMEP